MPKANPFSYNQRCLVLEFVDELPDARLIPLMRAATELRVRVIVNVRQLWIRLIDEEGREPVDFLLNFIRELKRHGVDARLVRAGITCVRNHLKAKRYPTTEVLYDQVADTGRHSPQARPVEHDPGRAGASAGDQAVGAA